MSLFETVQEYCKYRHHEDGSILCFYHRDDDTVTDCTEGAPCQFMVDRKEEEQQP